MAIKLTEKTTFPELVAPVLAILRKNYKLKSKHPVATKCYEGLVIEHACFTIDSTFFNRENIEYHAEQGRDLLDMAMMVAHNQGREQAILEEKRRYETLERLFQSNERHIKFLERQLAKAQGRSEV